MNWLILLLVSLFSPVVQTQVEKAVNRLQARVTERAPQPPEVGQTNVIYHHGEWWKFEQGQWLVWRQHVLAQGGSNVFR